MNLSRTRLKSSNFCIFCKYIYIYTETTILYKDFKNTKKKSTCKRSKLEWYLHSVPNYTLKFGEKIIIANTNHIQRKFN